MLNGESVKSCTVLAAQADGATITTIEGLAPSDTVLHPMQESFQEHHGLQCGYCTPGFVVSLFAEQPDDHWRDVGHRFAPQELTQAC